TSKVQNTIPKGVKLNIDTSIKAVTLSNHGPEFVFYLNDSSVHLWNINYKQISHITLDSVSHEDLSNNIVSSSYSITPTRHPLQYLLSTHTSITSIDFRQPKSSLLYQSTFPITSLCSVPLDPSHLFYASNGYLYLIDIRNPIYPLLSLKTPSIFTGNIHMELINNYEQYLLTCYSYHPKTSIVSSIYLSHELCLPFAYSEQNYPTTSIPCLSFPQDFMNSIFASSTISGYSSRTVSSEHNKIYILEENNIENQLTVNTIDLKKEKFKQDFTTSTRSTMLPLSVPQDISDSESLNIHIS
ncbi:hypothetical protein WA158_001292, partial [Blastocystis sp. Blastoise]